MKQHIKPSKLFDPIKYLGITCLGQFEINSLRKKLNKNISEYILIRLLEELPDKVDEQLKKKEVEKIDELEELLKASIPDFDKKVQQYFQEFKNQYKNE